MKWLITGVTFISFGVGTAIVQPPGDRGKHAVADVTRDGRVTETVNAEPVETHHRVPSSFRIKPRHKSVTKYAQVEDREKRPAESEAEKPEASKNPPERIKALLESPDRRPALGELEKLMPADQRALMALYNARTDPIDRIALTWGLAWVGDEKVVARFRETLFSELDGKNLSAMGKKRNRENAMGITVFTLGLLAQRHESAYNLAKDGADPDFWRQRVKWESDRGKDRYRLLASQSILAMGLSGRSEAMEWFRSLKSGAWAHERELVGAVVDAAFYQDMIRKNGLKFMNTTLFDLRDRFRLFREWKRSEAGKPWDEWYLETSELKEKGR